MKRSAGTVALVPEEVLTVTLTVPVPAGEVALHSLALQLTELAAFAPNLTDPPDRWLPVIVT
jgi:hypothetical protein